MRTVPENALDFVSQWEGCRLSSYADIVGVWTIGYGHTGPDVRPGMTITVGQARAFLRADLEEARDRLAARIGAVVDDLSEPQFIALLSFVFNLGANASWTIWKLLKARQFDQVPAQLARFVNAGGKPVKGLVRRRAAEVELWHEEASTDVLPSSATRVMATPPTPTDTKPLVASKSFMTTGLATLTAAGTALGELSKTVSPFASQSETVAHMVSTLAMISAGVAAAALLFVWLQKRKVA